MLYLSHKVLVDSYVHLVWFNWFLQFITSLGSGESYKAVGESRSFRGRGEIDGNNW